jgi:hypothetical protein
VVTILSICLLGTFGMCPRIMASIDRLIESATGFTAACIYDLKLALRTQMGILPQLRPEGDIAVIVVGPMLATNLISTSLIAWKAWYVVWLFVSVRVPSHDDEYPPTPGIITERWVRISEGVGLLDAWRKSLCF